MSKIDLSRRGLLTRVATVAAAVPVAALPAVTIADVASPAIAPPPADPDAALIALGEKLKAAIIEVDALDCGALNEQCWQARCAAGEDRGAGDAAFEAMAEKNGYHRAWKKWDRAGSKMHRLAKRILKMPAHTRVGEAIQVAAEIATNGDLYINDSKVLRKIAARAGFTFSAAEA